MDDVAALRQRVHGVTAATIAKPKRWDESKVKGYDPKYKFDESKVVRDKDKGEEGRFAKKNTVQKANPAQVAEANEIAKELDEPMPKSPPKSIKAPPEEWSPEQRREAAEKGWALPDGSFPIRTKDDWYKARQAIGRGGPGKRKVIIEHLRKRAAALGIPESELDGLTAAGDFRPELHPRARDGKFIEVGGWVAGLFKWGSPKDNDKNWRGKVVKIEPNPDDSADPLIYVEGENGQTGVLPSSSIDKAAASKASLELTDSIDDAKQLSLSDAPRVGPPGTRPDLGTPGMNIKQNVAMGPALRKHYDQIDADMKAGNDDYGRNSASKLSDDELDEAIADLDERIKGGNLGMSGPADLKVLREEKASRGNGVVEPDTEFVNSPDDLYEGLYAPDSKSPGDLEPGEQFYDGRFWHTVRNKPSEQEGEWFIPIERATLPGGQLGQGHVYMGLEEQVRTRPGVVGEPAPLRSPDDTEESYGPDASPVDTFVKGDLVILPNGKKAGVWEVDGDDVTVNWRSGSGRSNMQGKFKASQLKRQQPIGEPAQSPEESLRETLRKRVRG
jgi:hypothetical protein